MEQHWSKYCAMSIVNFMAYPETGSGRGAIVESVRRTASDDFFDVIEIAWIKDAEARREVRQILKMSQLGVGFGAQPAILSQKLNLNSADPAPRREALGQMRELVDQAAEL